MELTCENVKRVYYENMEHVKKELSDIKDIKDKTTISQRVWARVRTRDQFGYVFNSEELKKILKNEMTDTELQALAFMRL